MEAMMNRSNWLSSAGLVYVLVWIVGLLLESDTPGSTASTADLTAYFLAHQQAHMIQSYLIDGIAGVAILVFAATVAGIFRKFDEENPTLSSIVFGAGVAAASVSLVQAGMQQVLANRDVLAEGNAAPIRTILVMINATDTFKLLALALLSGTVSLLTFRTRALPQWTGWLGVILALLLIFGGWSFLLNNSALYNVLYLALPLLLLWVAAISVVILRRPK
jgi:hypothetical protein